MKISAVILLLLLCADCRSQAVLTGKVSDAGGYAIAGASIAVHTAADTTKKHFAIADSRGMFQLKGIAAGGHVITITAIRFQPYVSTITVHSNDRTVVLPDIVLKEDLKNLQNVTVTAPTKPIEAKEGRLIYNIERSLTAPGTTAFDQVQKTPGITVDAEDNLTLKGSTAVTILIDGKQTYLSGQQLSTYLKSLPAEGLQRIEVMATPSSQYDAAGNAGTINIITRKSNRQGYALTLKAGAGTGKFGQSTDGFTGNIRTGAVNFFGSYNYQYNHTQLMRTSFRTVPTNGKSITYDRHTIDPAIANNNSFKAGADFYLNKKTTLGLVYNSTHNRWTRTGVGPTYLKDAGGEVDSIAQNSAYTDEPAYCNAYNFNFSTQIDTAGTQFSADADYAVYHNNSNGYLDNGVYTPIGAALQPYQSLQFQQPSIVTIRSVKADWVKPAKNFTWKAGVKYAFVTTDNDFRYDSLLNSSYRYSAVLSNHFVYDERVAAAYASLTAPLRKLLSVDAGLRVEHTASKGALLNTGVVNNRDYTNWFPYLSITKILTGDNSLTASLSRRINRPLYANLNPTRYFFDKYSYHEGNPFLQPELAWNASLSYTLKQTYIATFTYSRTENAIMGFATQDTATGVLRVADRNFSRKTAADLLLVIPFQSIPKWSVQTTLDVIYLSYLYSSGKDFFQPKKLYADVQVAQTFSLPKGITAELTTYYTSPSLDGVYVLRRYFQMDAGVRKSFFNNKLDVVLTGKDLFWTDRYWAYSIYSGTSISYNHRPDSRRINLTLTYRLGGKLSVGKDRKLEEQNRL